MRKAIVITSIFEPNSAIQAYASMENYMLVVVGDRKTPIDWQCDGAEFIPLDRQGSMGLRLAEILPENHYSRKLLGYLWAMQHEAEVIIDTDDDNFPKANWGFPDFEGEFDCVIEEDGFVNAYQLFSKKKIWPRGFPLSLVKSSFTKDYVTENRFAVVGIWQGLADRNPDVDAIYRLISDEPCDFDERDSIILSRPSICPFNTQNTAIRQELFALLYLPVSVSFRFTDILRGLVAQPIMHLYGYELGFFQATVVQERNPHDYMEDFKLEISMYVNSGEIVELVTSTVSVEYSLEDNLYRAYEALFRNAFVKEIELVALDAWLADLDSLRVGV